MRALAQPLAIGVAGTLAILVGLVLVPLPGPGWPVVFFGIALLGREFAWARRLSGAVTGRVSGALRWSAAAAWPVRALLGVGLLVSTLGPAVVLTGLA